MRPPEDWTIPAGGVLQIGDIRVKAVRRARLRVDAPPGVKIVLDQPPEMPVESPHRPAADICPP